MLRLLSSLLAFFLFLPNAHADVSIGDQAPDFEAVNVLTDETVKLSDMRGKTVVLEWTNHECPYVVKHYDSGNMQAVQAESVNEYGVEWVTIVSSAPDKQGHVSAEKAAEIVEKSGAAPTAKILDETGEIGQAYGAQTTPHMFIVDADGAIVYQGAIDSNSSPRQSTIEGATNYVMASLESLEAGNPVEPSETAPYGCSVKY